MKICRAIWIKPVTFERTFSKLFTTVELASSLFYLGSRAHEDLPGGFRVLFLPLELFINFVQAF